MRTDTYAPELEPCPFCGGKAEFERTGNRHQSCIVSCTACGASHESLDQDGDSGKSWNHRTPPASAQSVECQHRIADARNPVVKSGYICVDCGALFSAADHSGESAQSVELWGWTGDMDGLSGVVCHGANVPEGMKNAIALGVITDAKSVEPVACTNCNGSGIGGGQMHVDENGNSEYEPYKCERCDGFGRTPPSAGDVRDAALEEAAKHLDKKADEYVHEFGCVDPDTGSLEFGQGPHADEKHEYYSTLLELAEEIRALKSKKEA